RSGFYANRYGRSSPPQDQDLPEIKIRSSRFIGGSRYGKRSGPLVPDVSSLIASTSEDEVETPAALLVGDSVVCLLIEVPDIYKCLK
ncbi:hypothetical protein SK128_001600, partial [Halocaridina rubra]